MQLMEASAAVTLAQVMEALEADDDRGFCFTCGERECEDAPEAQKNVCKSCGGRAVYIAEELFMALI